MKYHEEQKIIKDVEAGLSTDVIVGKYADKYHANTDEIRKVVKNHRWNTWKKTRQHKRQLHT